MLYLGNTINDQFLLHVPLCTFCTCRFCLFCPVLNGIFTLIYHNHFRDFLICSGREEFLRFNLEDFWNTEIDRIESEELMNLSWYHPLRLFAKFMCKFFSHESDYTFTNAQLESALGVGGPTLYKWENILLCGKKHE